MGNYHYTLFGPIFFDDKIEFKHKKPIDTVSKIKEKEEVNSCPLCGGKYYLMTGKMQIDVMIENWLERTNFNPIADVYRHSFLEKRRCLDCGLYFYNYHLPDSEDLYKKIMETVPYYTNYRWEYGAATEFIEKQKPKSLIEIGAGTGNFVERIKNVVSHVLASEYNREAIEICRQKGIDTSTEDISKLNQKFDIVCAFEVLEHVWHTKPFMENCLNLLNKGGWLIFGTPDPEGALAINGTGFLNLPPHHQFEFSYQSFEYLAKTYNLKILEYKKSELDYRTYLKYVENITKKPLTAPDIQGYLETKKSLTGHSHFVVFEKP
ncbi:MAG: class I SAM-dependent methyltransferase [Lactobacillaceae bacterium]|jgi:2-polyprenyl-3-methyl-5-hydroxy-6-metoxy-1,4-benzoquinol methylase|nr:class I SAM-dependent methyltransferase [Lactobacillaceae bacterium]